MDKRNIIAVFLLAVIIRGGALLLMPDALRTDPDGYLRLAENLVAHGTFGEGDRPTAYRPPLYPLMLSGCVALGENYQRLAIGLLHVLLGAATAAIAYALARRWGLSARAALLAAGLVIFDPILLNQSAQIMTETAAAFFTAAGLLALSGISLPSPFGRGAGGEGCWCLVFTLLSGIVLGMGALSRPTLLPWTAAAGAMLAIQVWYCRRRQQPPIEAGENSATGVASYKLPAAFFIGAILAVAPWAIRNQAQFGRPIVTTTHGGYTLLLANNPSFYQWLREGRWGSVWPAEEFNAAWLARRPRDELSSDRLAYQEARGAIAAEPGMFAWACLVRMGRFWLPLAHQVAEHESPARKAARWSAAVWYVLVFLSAIVGAWGIFVRRPASPPCIHGGLNNSNSPCIHGGLNNSNSPCIHGGLNVLLLLACLTAVHAVYWTDMRMRAPAMPAVALLAAAGWFFTVRKPD